MTAFQDMSNQELMTIARIRSPNDLAHVLAMRLAALPTDDDVAEAMIEAGVNAYWLDCFDDMTVSEIEAMCRAIYTAMQSASPLACGHEELSSALGGYRSVDDFLAILAVCRTSTEKAGLLEVAEEIRRARDVIATLQTKLAGVERERDRYKMAMTGSAGRNSDGSPQP